jgi:hypothetical protein
LEFGIGIWNAEIETRKATAETAGKATAETEKATAETAEIAEIF